jgi:hypothetical protein
MTVNKLKKINHEKKVKKNQSKVNPFSTPNI